MLISEIGDNYRRTICIAPFKHVDFLSWSNLFKKDVGILGVSSCILNGFSGHLHVHNIKIHDWMKFSMIPMTNIENLVAIEPCTLSAPCDKFVFQFCQYIEMKKAVFLCVGCGEVVWVMASPQAPSALFETGNPVMTHDDNGSMIHPQKVFCVCTG